VSLEVSPRIAPHGERIGEVMYSNQPKERLAAGEPAVLRPKLETRFKDTAAKFRFGLDENGQPRPKIRCLTYAEAIFEAMIHRFYEDPTMAAWGEENRDWGGAFGAYRGLTEALPYPRLFNSPSPRARSWARPWAMRCPAAARCRS
jgi:2-oxoisovalerate dehydrogenase E1 component